MKTYNSEELARGNGEEGKPSLVAVHGKVYDVSPSKKWVRGNHMKRHQAGMDLSCDITAAPHGVEVLDRFKLVGVYQEKPKEAAQEGFRGKVEVWLGRHPFFRRHPHPAVVHIPVGLFVVIPLFEVLALVLGSGRTEWAAYCCLLVGGLTIPAAMATGYFTWWINYDFVDSPIIATKRRLAWTVLALALLAILLRSFAPFDPLEIRNTYAALYFVAVITLGGVMPYIGFLGGKLTFPYKDE